MPKIKLTFDNFIDKLRNNSFIGNNPRSAVAPDRPNVPQRPTLRSSQPNTPRQSIAVDRPNTSNQSSTPAFLQSPNQTPQPQQTIPKNPTERPVEGDRGPIKRETTDDRRARQLLQVLSPSLSISTGAAVGDKLGGVAGGVSGAGLGLIAGIAGVSISEIIARRKEVEAIAEEAQRNNQKAGEMAKKFMLELQRRKKESGGKSLRERREMRNKLNN